MSASSTDLPSAALPSLPSPSPLDAEISDEDIEAASERLKPYLRPTALVHSASLSTHTKRDVWLKLETQQPTGSFKIRPALHGILQNLEYARRYGVIASSSGNFAQAVAYAAHLFQIDAQIVMMEGTSPYKIERTRQFGAQVVLCQNTYEDRWETTYRIQRESGRLLLHPFDSPETIAANGTIGLEILEHLQGPLCVLVPVSGGGLISGIAGAIKRRRPQSIVIGVQPLVNGSLARSLAACERVQVPAFQTVADALTSTLIGERPFAIAKQYVDQALFIEDKEMMEAVRFLAIQQKLVVEAGGAIGVAALLFDKLDTQVPEFGMIRHVVCILSGGNIHPPQLARVLEG